MNIQDYTKAIKLIYDPVKHLKPLDKNIRLQLGKLFYDAMQEGISLKSLAESVGVKRRTAQDWKTLYQIEKYDPEKLNAIITRKTVTREKPKEDTTPPTKLKRLTIYLPEDQHKKFKAYSAMQGLSMTRLIEDHIRGLIK